MYKIQSLVENNYNFGLVYSEKQNSVKDATGLDFDLSGIVKFLQKQTNNFTIENTIAKDLDEAIYKIVQKFEAENGKQPITETETTETPEQVEQGIKDAIELLEMIGDDASEEEKEALEILKSLV